MVLVFAEQSTNRLNYVLQVWFQQLLNIPYRITTDFQEFLRADAVKINYSSLPTEEGLQIRPHGLLAQRGVQEVPFRVAVHQGLCKLFADESGSYDPLAATFFLITRYEEYLPFDPDRHGRFPDEANTLCRLNVAQQPLVHYYLDDVLQQLAQRYRSFAPSKPKFSFLLTYDIDVAYAYRFRPWWRTGAAFIRDVITGNFGAVKDRTMVLSGQRRDPYDTFDVQESLHQQFGLRPIYFFLVANYGPFHKNIPWHAPQFSGLVQACARKGEVGLHAGYDASYDEKVLSEEKQRLESLLKVPVRKNRFHFLRFRLPHSYRLLLKLGLIEEYSMGFATRLGFRAGIAAPFTWYDLQAECITPMRIVPIAVMDATLYYHLKLGEHEALSATLRLLHTVRELGGQFQFLAHNDLLADRYRWRSWSPCFRMLLEQAIL
ncbi:MAG: polysaccharide deacetylase family protein [Chitinophagales bacterium]|nr:polysaccharide deacetylase family protein [Chitinophagales bacterium]MDW8428127.1 polysaccharide deacetylase family protein [Chitinophagales bacterium]